MSHTQTMKRIITEALAKSHTCVIEMLPVLSESMESKSFFILFVALFQKLKMTREVHATTTEEQEMNRPSKVVEKKIEPMLMSPNFILRIVGSQAQKQKCTDKIEIIEWEKRWD